MAVREATGLATPVMTASSCLKHKLLVESYESLYQSTLRDKDSDDRGREHETAQNEALQEKHDNAYNIVEVIHYRPRSDSQSRADKRFSVLIT